MAIRPYSEYGNMPVQGSRMETRFLDRLLIPNRFEEVIYQLRDRDAEVRIRF